MELEAMSASMCKEGQIVLIEHHSEDLAKLAEEHMKHDLEPSDREVLEKAAGKVSVPAAIGTIVGLGLGVYAAFRLRKARVGMFNAFRATEKPTHVVFAGGRTGTRVTSSLYQIYVLLTTRCRICPGHHAVPQAHASGRLGNVSLLWPGRYNRRWRAGFPARHLVCSSDYC